MCVQEEGRLKQEKIENVNFVSHNKGQSNKGKNIPKGKGNQVLIKKKGDKKKVKYFFCKKLGHLRRTASSTIIGLRKMEVIKHS